VKPGNLSFACTLFEGHGLDHILCLKQMTSTTTEFNHAAAVFRCCIYTVRGLPGYNLPSSSAAALANAFRTPTKEEVGSGSTTSSCIC